MQLHVNRFQLRIFRYLVFWISLILTLFGTRGFTQSDLPLSKELAKMVMPGSTAEWMKFRETTWINPETIFQVHKKAFGLQEQQDQMKMYRSETDELGLTHYRYQQFYKGIEVEGAEMLVHAKDGFARKCNGKLARGLDLNITPAITKETALKEALKAIGAKQYMWQDEHGKPLKKLDNNRNDSDTVNNNALTTYPRPELVITRTADDLDFSPGNFKLAYKMNIYSKIPFDGYAVYIGAYTGTFLKKIRLMHSCIPGNACTQYNGAKSIETEFVPSSGNYRLFDNIRNIQTQISGADVFDNDNDWTTNCEATSAHWATEKTYDYYLNVHHRKSFDGLGGLMKNNIDPTLLENAYWEPANNQVRFGKGNGVNANVNHYLVSLDVVGHEWTHAVTQYEANLTYAYESGALNESFSDIFGTMVEYSAGAGDYQIGEDFWIPGGKMRDMSNPHSKNQPDTYKGTYWATGASDFGGIHTNSGVQNKWFYLLAEAGSGTNNQPKFPYRYTVNGIGRDKAVAIAYKSLTEKLTSGSTYLDAREGAIWAAEELYGETSNEVAQVKEAWCAVGVGDCPTFSLNKDFSNTTADSVDGILLRLKGSYDSLSLKDHYDGDDPWIWTRFSMRPAGPGGFTFLRWTGLEKNGTPAKLPPGGDTHVGFEIATQFVEIDSWTWLKNGASAGEAVQVNARRAGNNVAFENDIGLLPDSTIYYVKNLILEYYKENQDLDSLNGYSDRDPSHADTIPGTITLPPDQPVVVPVPSPSDSDNWVIVIYDLSPDSTLADTTKTTDYLQFIVQKLPEGEPCCDHPVPPSGPPVNDDCADAVNLNIGAVSVIGNNIGATNSASDPGGCSSGGCTWASIPDATVWYKFTTVDAGWYTIGTDNGTNDFGGDYQLMLLSGTCGNWTDIACSEDNGSENTLAAQITALLAANTTYYIMADVWDTDQGYFFINVFKNERPVNDCVLDAIDITSDIAAISNTEPFISNAYIYNSPGGADCFSSESFTYEDPNTDIVEPADAGCNPNPLTAEAYRGVWFKFDKDNTTNDTWINVFPTNGGIFYIMTLFKETGTVELASGETCSDSLNHISGLTYIDCSAGDGLYSNGEDRDRAKGSSLNQPRLDLSSLEDGTYYIRVSQWPHTDDNIPAGIARPEEGIFNLVIEAAPDGMHSIDGISANHCDEAMDIGCPEGAFVPNRNVNLTYYCLSNAGFTGNLSALDGGTAYLLPDLRKPVEMIALYGLSGQFQQNCGTEALTGRMNEQVNNTAIYKFNINSGIVNNSPLPSLCNADVAIEFSNICYAGTNGNRLFASIVKNDCEGNVGPSVMAGWTTSYDSALCMGTITGILPDGEYFLFVDGENQQVLKYDLTLNINYLDPVTGDNCGTECGSSTIKVQQKQNPGQLALNYIRPVPATDYIEISYNTIRDEQVDLVIYDIMGKNVRTERIASTKGNNFKRLDIASLVKGVYLLSIRNYENHIQSAFIKTD